MPIYEYVCQDCRTKFDQLVRSMSAAGPYACPNCGSKQTDKALSVFAVGAASGQSSASDGHGTGCACCASAPSCPMRQ